MQTRHLRKMPSCPIQGSFERIELSVPANNPIQALPDDLLKEAVPGNIRRAEHFVAFLKRFVEYLKASGPNTLSKQNSNRRRTRMKVRQVISETPPSFLAHLKEYTFIEKKPLRFCAERLTSLVRTLELTNIEDYQPLQEVATFATLVALTRRAFFSFLSRTSQTPLNCRMQCSILLVWMLPSPSNPSLIDSAQSSLPPEPSRLWKCTRKCWDSQQSSKNRTV